MSFKEIFEYISETIDIDKNHSSLNLHIKCAIYFIFSEKVIQRTLSFVYIM